MPLFIGTSGWDYREWKGGFYPGDLAQSRFLEHYARVLTACEANATFHRIHSKESVRRWAGSVPDSFRFAVKVHRRITHRKELAPVPDPFLERFLDSLEPLAPRLGCLLLQFPPTRERDDESLGRLLAALPEGLPFACEFRHPSWHVPEVSEQMADRDGTVCVAETEGSVPDRLPPGPIAYVRLRAERYPDNARAGWLELLRAEAGGRDIYTFAKHEGVPAGDPFAGVGLAQWLVGQTVAAEAAAKAASSP